MSETTFPPFLKWSEYKSNDEKNPDKIVLKPLEIETFETEYSINAKVEIKQDNEWTEVILPLHSFESNNNQLLQLWTKAIKDNKIKVRKKFKILTWLGTSKNNRTIRRFELVF